MREATYGRIDIRIYGSSQLGDYTVVQEKVSLGSVEMSCESVSTQVDKRFLSYILPYVAKDYATAKKNFGTGTPYAKYCANLFDKQEDVYKRQGRGSPPSRNAGRCGRRRGSSSRTPRLRAGTRRRPMPRMGFRTVLR